MRLGGLLQEGFDAGGDGLLGLGGGDEALEEAEVGVNGEVVVSDKDGAGDRGAHEAHFGDEGKDEGVAMPGAAFLREFDGDSG